MPCKKRTTTKKKKITALPKPVRKVNNADVIEAMNVLTSAKEIYRVGPKHDKIVRTLKEATDLRRAKEFDKAYELIRKTLKEIYEE